MIKIRWKQINHRALNFFNPTLLNKSNIRSIFVTVISDMLCEKKKINRKCYVSKKILFWKTQG